MGDSGKKDKLPAYVDSEEKRKKAKGKHGI